MNPFSRLGFVFVGGVVLGALGVIALSRGKLQAATVGDLIQSGEELGEKIKAGLEGLKEDAAEIIAQAREASARRKADREMTDADSEA